MNIVDIGVENPDDLLNPNAYGPGAKVVVERSPVGGLTATYVAIGSVPIESGVTRYEYFDQQGTTTQWYRTHYADATGTITSESSAERTVSPTLLTVDEFRSRVRTNASDAAIQASIDANIVAINAVAGPLGARSDIMYSLRQRFLWLPAQAASITGVTEIYAESLGVTDIVLDPSDWLLSSGRSFLERLWVGNHPADLWGPRVSLDWVPIDDSANRSRVLEQLVKLDLNNQPGLGAMTVGDVSWSRRGEQDYGAERDAILGTLLLQFGGAQFA